MRSGRRVLRSVLRPVRVDPHYARDAKASSWWGDRSGITVGQTRASGRNQHWGRAFGRCAARRASPLSQGRRRGASEKEGGRGLRPCEEPGARAFCPYVVLQLQKSAGGCLASNKHEHALQKGETAHVNGGLAGAFFGAKVSNSASCEGVFGSRSRTGNGPRPAKARDGVRTPSSGGIVAQAALSSRDRGCNGHRILRRVPDDGRRSGST
jgi:hypothetical protein